MNDIKSNLILNIEINNPELISRIDEVSTELSLTLEQFIAYSIDKLLSDIKYVRNLRVINKSK